MKIFKFWKTNFLSITFTFIDDFALNIDEMNDFFSLWPFMAFLAFIGLCWPWMNFLSKDQPFVIKVRQNWAVSNNQMSKPISESKLLIYRVRNWYVKCFHIGYNIWIDWILEPKICVANLASLCWQL